MNFNLVSQVGTCYSFISQNQDFLSFVYYSHIPTTVFALIVGVFVFIKDKRSLVSKLLLGIVVSFSLWTSLDLIIWKSYDSRLIMFAWSLLGILNVLFFILSLYFIYVFIEKKDVSFGKKIIFSIFLLPMVLLTPTIFNLKIFDIANCQAVEGKYFTSSYYLIGFFIALWIAFFAFFKYKRAESHQKKQIIFISLGIELFLMSFFSTGLLNSYLVGVGFITDTVSFKIEQYGLFGMAFFMGFLAYMIVKFKAFHIKMLAAQALVVAIVALISAQFFFTPLANVTNIVLIGITVFVSAVLGIWLVKSVKDEVRRKDQLQKMTDSLAETNDKLRVINAKLERIDATKTDFIYIASHQLHKVPTPIKGYLSMLLEGSYGKLSKEQRRVLENIKLANDRQINLVDDLLNASRLEYGKVKLDFKKQYLEDICREIYDTVLPVAEEKGLKFKYEKPKAALPELILDKGKIFEAIFNFVDNAVKYTRKGKVEMEIELDERSHYQWQAGDDEQKEILFGPVVRVTVSDTGVGIAKENIPYLFAKFSRKDTANLNVEGTGLGLYVVKLMVEAHGGRTWAESEGEGKGSRFIIEIPTKQPENVVAKEV